ncbi:MAG: NifB/NifX family molybdenum-iron cluster-binding protein [Candidatus Omnitrophota bacterium]|jgi:predicted Fe-Mo cluster-binding NifX family protein
MKICIPTETKDGAQAKPFGHFGSAPYFTIYDTETKAWEFVENGNQHHSHGTCQPLQFLANQKIDTVVCQGMGARAVQKLNEGGIRVYRVASDTVEEVLKESLCGALEEITPANACTNHSCH